MKFRDYITEENILNEDSDPKATLVKIKASISNYQNKLKTSKKPEAKAKIKDSIAKLKNRAANLQMKMKTKPKIKSKKKVVKKKQDNTFSHREKKILSWIEKNR